MTAYLNALGLVCALGRDKQEVARKLFAGDCSGVRAEAGWVPERTLPVAAVRGELVALPDELSTQHSRNNQLLMEATLQIATKPVVVSPPICATSNSPPTTTIDNRNSAPRPASWPTGCNWMARPT